LPTFFPPEPGFAQHPVSGLPFPVHSAKFVAGFHQYRPNPLEDAVSAPALEPTVNRAVVAKVLGQFVPLAAAAEAEDDAIDGFSPVDSRAPSLGAWRRRRIFQKKRLNPLPEFVVDFPDRIKGPDLSAGPSHPCFS
jgi:hypothetical protein